MWSIGRKHLYQLVLFAKASFGRGLPLLGAVLASCGPDVVLEDVPRDRTLIVMYGGSGQYPLFDNHNPYTAGSFHLGTLPAMFEPLIMFNVLTGDHENWLAEHWEYDDSATVITVKLREGIEWADGQPFTTRDVAFTFNMLRDHTESMGHLADLPEFFDSTEVIDDHTVRLVLKKAGPAFWATTLSTNHGVFILPEHIWKDQDPLEFTFHDIKAGLPLGTGPYRLVYASPHQKIYDLRPDWWAAQTGFKPLPKVERIIYVPEQEESQAAQLLLTDQLDIASVMQVPSIESVLERSAQVVTFSDRQPPYGYLDWCPIDLNMNCSEPPFDDPQIRRAISMAIDRKKLVQLAESGAGVVALHPFTPYDWFAPFDEALQEILARHGYDADPHPQEVSRIMEAKGYRKDDEGLWTDAEGERLEITIQGWASTYTPPLIEQLRDAGFDASTEPGQTPPVSLGCKGPSGVQGMDPYLMLSYYTSRSVSWSNSPRWRNEEFDRIVDRIAPLQVGDEKLLGLFVEAMEIWVRELPDIFLGQLIIRHPCNTTYWTGWPSQQDPYSFLNPLQWETLKIFIRLQPAGESEPQRTTAPPVSASVTGTGKEQIAGLSYGER